MSPRLRLRGAELAKQRAGSRVVSIDPRIAAVSGRKRWRERRKGRGKGDRRDGARAQ